MTRSQLEYLQGKGFSRWARHEGISDEELLKTIKEMESGLVGNNLGSNLYKKRIARKGEGKSGGYRTLIGCKLGNTAFYLYGFPKNHKANISAKEKRALKELAATMLGMSDKNLQKLSQAAHISKYQTKRINIMDKSVLDAVHESAKELHKAGAIEQQTMRKFDALCLPPVKQMKGADIRRLREREGVSQPVFAAYLNTSKSTVSKWERDEKRQWEQH
ncbi:type II toxin-antitoxin system RelE/ParE family toxin [Aliamphritea spongicola]|nr:type II toxin-antitoxin system RelE/ParE family toxin [Aliamphritea spongicola]